MQNSRVVVILLILTYTVQAVEPQEKLKQAVRTGTATSETMLNLSRLSMPTTDLSTPTTEQALVTFPPGDVLNDPWFKKIKFVFPDNETLRQGLRNAWPYVYPFSAEFGGQVVHGTRILNKAKDIAVNPILRAKLYCLIIGYPLWGENSVHCLPGSSNLFVIRWNHSPIGMMRDNIPLSVLNAILAFLSLMLGIFGNILIIISILTKKELKSSTNLILVGIAVADCLNSITIVFHGYLETFLWTITNPVLGPVGCGVIRTLKEFSQLLAVNHLITLSFERYFAICWPTKESLKFTQKKTFLVVLVNWIIAGIQIIPFVILRVPLDGIDYAEYMCHGTTPYKPWIFIVYNLTVYLLLPIPILCFNYICAVRSLLTNIKRSQTIPAITAQARCVNRLFSPSEAQTNDLYTSWQTKAEKIRLKAIYMMITLVVIYIVTVTPGRIMDALKSYYIIGDSGIFYIKKVAGTVDMVRGINSWTNVIVYTLISSQFRVAFKEVLCHCWRKPSGRDSKRENQNGKEETLAETMETMQV